MWKGKYGLRGLGSRSLSLNETEVDGPFVDTVSVWGLREEVSTQLDGGTR